MGKGSAVSRTEKRLFVNVETSARGERRGGMKAMDHLQSEVLMEARAAEHAHLEKTGERRDYGMANAVPDRFEGFD